MKAKAQNTRSTLKIMSALIVLATALSLCFGHTAFADEPLNVENPLVSGENAAVEQPVGQALVTVNSDVAVSTVVTGNDVAADIDATLVGTDAEIAENAAQGEPDILAAPVAPAADAIDVQASTSVYGCEEARDTTYSLIASFGTTLATEDDYKHFERILKDGYFNYTNYEWSSMRNTFTATFASYEDLLDNTWAMDTAWNKDKALADRVLFICCVSNAKLAISEALNRSGLPLYNVEFLFSHVTVTNEYDDNRFNLSSRGHVAVTFEDCDILQNIQPASKTDANDAAIDVTFRRCNFNGDHALDSDDRQNDEALDNAEGDNDETTTGSSQNDPSVITMGGNLGNLLIEDCANINGIEVDGQGDYSFMVIDSTFVDNRLTQSTGSDIEYKLVYANGFAQYIFQGNTLVNGAPIYVEGFKNAAWNTPINELDRPSYWLTVVENADGELDNAVVNSTVDGFAWTSANPNEVGPNNSLFIYMSSVTPETYEEPADQPGSGEEGDNNDPSTDPEQGDNNDPEQGTGDEGNEGNDPEPGDNNEGNENNDPEPGNDNDEGDNNEGDETPEQGNENEGNGDEQGTEPEAGDKPETGDTDDESNDIPDVTPTTTVPTPEAPAPATNEAAEVPVATTPAPETYAAEFTAPVETTPEATVEGDEADENAATEIADDENPLAASAEIADEATPLAGAASQLPINLIMMGLATVLGIGLVAFILMRTRREEEEN